MSVPASARLSIGLSITTCWIAACASAPPPEQAEQAEQAEETDAATASSAGMSAPAVKPAPLPDAGPIEAAAALSDQIFEQEVPRSEAFWTADGKLYNRGQEITLRGFNWFGLDTRTLALHGPPQVDREVGDFLRQMQTLGFNALRLPLSPEAIAPGSRTEAWAVRGQLDTGREHLDELLSQAASIGIYVLLDVHTCAAAVGHTAGEPRDPACGDYDEDAWVDDLTTLAGLARDYAPWVVGIDLFNEPHAVDWGQWRALVELGGEAVLRENPNILVFVEGIGSRGYSGGPGPFWGENLTLALADPIALPDSRLVYSPHVYGPSVANQPYFARDDFPANMPAIWDLHFGHLFAEGRAVVVGEFGGQYQGEDRIWQDAFVDYLARQGTPSFFYWCLNPNSGDTGGLLLDDWRTVDDAKLELLQRLM